MNTRAKCAVRRRIAVDLSAFNEVTSVKEVNVGVATEGHPYKNAT